MVMGEDYITPKYVQIKCMNAREITSVEVFLQRVEMASDSDLEKMFGMMPHQVLDLKDTLNRSFVNFNIG